MSASSSAALSREVGDEFAVDAVRLKRIDQIVRTADENVISRGGKNLEVRAVVDRDVLFAVSPVCFFRKSYRCMNRRKERNSLKNGKPSRKSREKASLPKEKARARDEE